MLSPGSGKSLCIPLQADQTKCHDFAVVKMVTLDLAAELHSLGGDLPAFAINEEKPMTERNNAAATSGSDDVQAELERAKNLLKRIKVYRKAAEQADEKYTQEYTQTNENRSPSLDEMPYSEELIRTKDLPNSLSQAAKNLQAILDNKVAGQDPQIVFESAVEAIDDAEATLEDCIPIRKF